MILNAVKLNKELSSVRTQLSEFQVKLSENAKKMSADEDKIKELEEKIKSLEAEKECLESKLEDTKKEETAVVIATAESVDKQVIQKLAALGVPEGTVKEEISNPANTDAKSIYKQYEAIPNIKDKVEFFKKNQRAILNGMKMIHVFENPTVQKMKGSNVKQF